MENMDLSNLITALERDDRVSFAYLFGSRAGIKYRADSDLDIAIFFNKEPRGFDFIELISELTDITGIDVDLVSLNRAGPVLRHQVLKNGRKLLAKDSERLASFREKNMRDYYEYLEINGLIPEEDLYRYGK